LSATCSEEFVPPSPQPSRALLVRCKATSRLVSCPFDETIWEAIYHEADDGTNSYNSEVAMVGYQGDGVDSLLFEGPWTSSGKLN
jgi:hypothetical protein